MNFHWPSQKLFLSSVHCPVSLCNGQHKETEAHERKATQERGKKSIDILALTIEMNQYKHNCSLSPLGHTVERLGWRLQSRHSALSPHLWVELEPKTAFKCILRRNGELTVP